MTKQDAKFEDATQPAINLKAESVSDLNVISALLQDGVTQVSNISWLPMQQKMVIFFNRFRWEDCEDAKSKGRPFERVQSLLTFENVLSVQANGIDQTDAEMILSLLSIHFEEGEDGAGTVVLNIAGDGELRANVEYIDVSLKDVSRPYLARTKFAPSHPLD